MSEFDFKADGEIYSIAKGPNNILIIGDGEDTTYMYDLDKKELVRKEKINPDSVSIVKYSTDQKFLATASLDGLVHIFETSEYKHVRTINDINSEINVI